MLFEHKKKNRREQAHWESVRQEQVCQVQKRQELERKEFVYESQVGDSRELEAQREAATLKRATEEQHFR